MQTVIHVSTILIAIALFGSDRSHSIPSDPAGHNTDTTIVVGSKLFTESVILAELVAELAGQRGYKVVRRHELGGTRFVWNALLSGDIDVYAEYTGTLTEEILAGVNGTASVEDTLAALGIRMSKPLGFNNTYALGVKKSLADRLGLKAISDIARHPELRLAFSNEFIDRGDGWRGLRAHYGLPQRANGLDHSLAYRGLEGGSIDIIDLYSTDAEIDYYDLAILVDDRNYFPRYDAIYLYRSDLVNRAGPLAADIESLQGRISDASMVAMNASVKIDGLSEREVAAEFLSERRSGQSTRDGRASRIMQRTKEHLGLVLISLFFAVLLAIPLGIAAAKVAWLRSPVLGLVAILYTIPSLALLVFMIPLLGIGAVPAIAALFIYSLLPIVRNTYEGLVGIPTHLRETADSLGIAPLARLLQIELPLASRSILGGIKTAAVINIGTATLGALIGAGGYGQPILSGIRLDNIPLILEGAVPAALLAVTAQGVLELIGRWLIPRGLRDERATGRQLS